MTLALAALSITWLTAQSNAGQSKNKTQAKSQAKTLPAPQPAKPTAEAIIDSTKHDFGEVFAGEELEHTFTIRNVGLGALELSQTPLTAQAADPYNSFIRPVSFDRFSASLSNNFTFAAMRAAPS